MKRLFVAAALAATMLLASVSPAFGASHNPTGEYKQFAECPMNNPTVFVCVYSVSSGGGFTVGNKEVPLVNPVVLQGGLDFNGEFYGAENGDTLQKVPQPVPGGLLGIKAPTWWPNFIEDWFNDQINDGLTGVTATVELAAPATDVVVNPINLLTEQGTAIGLPVKIKLSNAILGNNCYIGSNSNPVQIDFTTGTTAPPPPNTPIKGSAGEFTENEAHTIVTLKGGVLVNNSFAAPGASGCGGIFSFLVDPLVNSILGAPSPAGKNTASLKGVLQNGDVAAIKASE